MPFARLPLPTVRSPGGLKLQAAHPMHKAMVQLPTVQSAFPPTLLELSHKHFCATKYAYLIVIKFYYVEYKNNLDF